MVDVLVTGAAGFIGRNLVEYLVSEDNMRVVGIDNDTSKTPPPTSMIWDDITLLDTVSGVPQMDWVYHLAASADIRMSLSDTRLDMRNNVLGTQSVLEYMRKTDTPNLVFASSSAVYGEASVTPTSEDTPLYPISLYGASKAAAEAFINSYVSVYGLRAWVFRFANVIGRYQHRGVIIDFKKKLAADPSHLEILGDGKQEKSYVDVSDCVSGLIRIPRHAVCGVYNLANTSSLSVRRLADIMCDTLGLSTEYVFTGGDRGWTGDVPVTVLSSDKARRAGWSPRISCEDAIRRMVR